MKKVKTHSNSVKSAAPGGIDARDASAEPKATGTKNLKVKAGVKAGQFGGLYGGAGGILG